MIPERRLLSAVVALAVHDACATPLIKNSKATGITADAKTALAFLFGKGLDAYALWLDFDPDQFRQNLLTMRPGKHLSDNERRNFKANYKLWKK